MKTPYEYRHIPRLTIACTLLASCLLAWGCQQQASQEAQSAPKQAEKHTLITYPPVVYDVPYCYDNPANRPQTKKQKEEGCEDRSKDIYINFDLLAKSDSVLWKDITGILNDPSTQFWRISVIRVSDGSYVTGTWEKDKKGTAWIPKSKKQVRFKEENLKYEVLLRAHFEFCSNDTAEQCDEPSAKFEARYINFLLHDMTKEA